MKRLRDDALRNAVARRLYLARAEGRVITLDEAVGEVIDGAAPAYFVEFDSAYERILDYVKTGSSTKVVNPLKRAMYAEITRKCLAILARRPYLSISDVLARVLTAETASSFFITKAYALRRLRATTKEPSHLRLRTRKLF